MSASMSHDSAPEPPAPTDTPPQTDSALSAPAYRVLARKYRPATFADLIGQEPLVRTLTNAIASGRLAQAYLLTGIRGVGKTTAARIIARALNCIGPDGNGGPTAAPCGTCEHCVSIAEDRHVDVLEMDAASRTGVDDIRELIEGVRYRPISARYKVYIIDEVHMLSKNAFNALLKTLEEPPEHVRFVFATTEIRKVPVTVLSRCQRFDLRRVDRATLAAHLDGIAAAEKAELDPAARELIARAADGSVRDALSLLDQAMALGDGVVGEAAVRDMLGLADAGLGLDLFDKVMAGEISAALDLLADMYRAGADPMVVLRDLLEITHDLTRLKITPAAADTIVPSAGERERCMTMAEHLAMPALTRCWQMLLKGMQEVQGAPAPLAAAEMVLIRLAYAADLPPPAELVESLQNGARPTKEGTQPPPPTTTPPQRPASRTMEAGAPGAAALQVAPVSDPVAELPGPAPEVAAEAAPHAELGSFRAVVALASERREMRLHAELRGDVHLVRFEPGRIEFRPVEHAERDLASRLGGFLDSATGTRWVVSVSSETGGPTLAEQDSAAEQRRLSAAEDHPLIKAAMAAFPGARVERVRDIAPPADDRQEGDPET